MQPDIERKTYNVGEAAHLLGVSKTAVYIACRRGELPALRVGSRWVLPRDALDALLAAGSPVELRQRRRETPTTEAAPRWRHQTPQPQPEREPFLQEVRRKIDALQAERESGRGAGRDGRRE